MKKLNLTALTAAVLMGGSLLASSGAMALSTDVAAHTTAGTACHAYSPTQYNTFKPDWSSLKSTVDAWVHCPGEGMNGAGTYDFNLEIPVDATKDIYNCYVAYQKIGSTGSSSRAVAWDTGSDAGIAKATVTAPTTLGGAAVVPAEVTLTAGCFLGASHMLHSVVAK